jgi:hypothetical protein
MLLFEFGFRPFLRDIMIVVPFKQNWYENLIQLG